MYIYITINLITGKVYVGLSKFNPNENPDYLGSGKLLKKAIKKYGRENFRKEIIEESDDKDYILKQERYWISYYNSRERNIGYNISEGGTWGDSLTYHPNKEQISKNHSKRVKGKGNPRYGDHRSWNELYTDEKSKKLKEQGRKRLLKNNPMNNSENRKKVSESKLGEKNINAKKWKIISPSGEIIFFIGGLKRKLEELGLTYMKIVPVLKKVKSDYNGWKIEEIK